MFGCSDVYHWMGRTAKAVCLPDCGRTSPKSLLGRFNFSLHMRCSFTVLYWDLYLLFISYFRS
jgi:hypothetical protein